MKRHDLVFRRQALRDLDGIYKSIILATGNPDLAARYRDRIVATCSRIGDAPEGGRNRDDIRPGLRTWAFERRMIIAYRVERRRVRIIRIIDGRRDYFQVLAADRLHSS